MFSVVQKGNFEKTTAFLKFASSKPFLTQLNSMGIRGVNALRAATPIDSGETATSWEYQIVQSETSIGITWTNRVFVGAAPLAVLLQYGHGTRNGGYVQGRDFINPAMKPIFDEIAKEAWAVLTTGR